MARKTRKKAVNPPTRTSSRRPPKPTEKAPKKRSYSISTDSASTAKKVKSKPAAPPLRSPTPPRPLLSPPSPRRGLPSLILTMRMRMVDVVEKDGIEELLPPAPVRFMSVWKAVNGKETLPGTRSAVLTENTLYLTSIEVWRDKVLLDLLPRKFKIQQLEAIASYEYEKARVCDICQQQIVEKENLVQAIEIVKEWHQRWPSRSLRLEGQSTRHGALGFFLTRGP